jgi:aldehyde dehydrogenase (NAD+)
MKNMAVESGAEQQQHGMSRVNMEARLAFKSGVTRSLQWRLRQLDAISTLITKHESQLCQAAFTDLGKSPFEVYSNEACLSISISNPHLPL